MKVVDKENNIVKDICPSCGKDGATIQTTEYADGSKYIEVMCLNGCGHFARIIKRESELIDKQMDNEEWFCNLDTEDKAREISDMTAQGYWSEELVEKWLKQPHKKE